MKGDTEMAERKTTRAQSEIEALNKAVVQHYWNGKWNERRTEILDELQTPDLVYHGSSIFYA